MNEKQIEDTSSHKITSSVTPSRKIKSDTLKKFFDLSCSLAVAAAPFAGFDGNQSHIKLLSPARVTSVGVAGHPTPLHVCSRSGDPHLSSSPLGTVENPNEINTDGRSRLHVLLFFPLHVRVARRSTIRFNFLSSLRFGKMND